MECLSDTVAQIFVISRVTALCKATAVCSALQDNAHRCFDMKEYGRLITSPATPTCTLSRTVII